MTTHLSKHTAVAILAVLLLPAGAFAQEWRGMGRVGGKVVDEDGKPVPDVTIKAALPRADNRSRRRPRIATRDAMPRMYE